MEGRSLWQLLPGQQAVVKEIKGEGSMTRRLMDIGLVKGTQVECVGASPLGDPKAYLIRGAVVGLRGVDSQNVLLDDASGKNQEAGCTIALAGNPNVGKSTVFNQLTGLNQHTGNWIGKTIENAEGYCSYKGSKYKIVDIPGCYSLLAHSAEEEIARDFICFGKPDVVVVVCDATCLERNLNLVLQVMEASKRVIVCVNLMDEAKKKHINIRLNELEKRLGTPVVGTAARSRKGIDQILLQADSLMKSGKQKGAGKVVTYPEYLEKAVDKLKPETERFLNVCQVDIDARWLSIRLLDPSDNLCEALERLKGIEIKKDPGISQVLKEIHTQWGQQDITVQKLKADIAASIVARAETICRGAVNFGDKAYDRKDRQLDWIFTSRITGFLLMFLMLLGIFWITITGANYPSGLLSKMFQELENWLLHISISAGLPPIIYEPLLSGVFRVLAWVVSVMLPPMAIFFPLFTLLEDFGYLPRVAYNLDKCFQKCNACGKQALSMCMGFGCNAAGVIGCRIIDSPRERLIAMITNNFVPCNGRFPTLIAIITMFFAGTAGGMKGAFLSALLVAGTILLGILMTFLVSRILSATILKGIPSSFTLELPPYRRPQILKVIVRSIFDRTLFVLGRAVLIAAPAGLIIWALANIKAGDLTLLAHCVNALDPFARCLGMDGVILMAFILGFPANEIVVPLIIMAYMANGSLIEITDLSALKTLLVDNGWTWVTAVSTMLFTLMHWPCSTTCLTLKKETGSFKWTAAAFFIPAVMGMGVCFIFNLAAGCLRI